jgi:hypothetical protein
MVKWLDGEMVGWLNGWMAKETHTFFGWMAVWLNSYIIRVMLVLELE